MMNISKYPKIRVDSAPVGRELVVKPTKLFSDLNQVGLAADLLPVRNGGSLAGKAFFLNIAKADFYIVRDDLDILCLVPLKKK